MDDPAFLILGRALACDSLEQVQARAKAMGKGGGVLRQAVDGNPLDNVRVGPTPLMAVCHTVTSHAFAPLLSGFDDGLLSRNVRLSENRLTARHSDSTGDALFGIVFGNAPVARFEHGNYFEVAVTETRAGQSDGLVIGVTTRLPASSAELTEAADALSDAWSFGYDGHASVRDSSTMIPITFNSKDLQVGDRLGLLIEQNGCPRLFVNHRLVAGALPGNVPTNVPLYAFVDLLGSARGVALVPNAHPPSMRTSLHSEAAPPQASMPSPSSASSAIPRAVVSAQPVELESFHETLIGRNVELLEGSISVRHTDPRRDKMYGIVFGNAPIPSFPEGSYFEVRIDGTRRGENDGLVIGVTKELPVSAHNLPEVADTLPRSWSFGYDGHARSTGRRMVPISWHPKDLCIGDVVGLIIRPFGSPQLVINRRQVVELPGMIPTAEPLYAFIDLLGNTTAATLMVGAAPPPLFSPLHDSERMAQLGGRSSNSCQHA